MRMTLTRSGAVAVLSALMVLSAQGQPAPAPSPVTTISVPDMDCPSCAKGIVTKVSAVAGVPLVPPPVEAQRPVELAFGGFARYPDLSGRLAADVNALCLDLHHNYRHNKGFADVYAEVHRLFHHVMDETRGWTRVAAQQVGTDTLPEKVAGVEAVLHHLEYDVGIKQAEQQGAAKSLPVIDPNEEAPAPGKR